LSASDGKTTPDVTVNVQRAFGSYSTVGGNNPELKGKDIMTFINTTTGETFSIPVSTVPNRNTPEGRDIGGAVAPGPISITLGAKYGSNFDPVMTITAGTTISGETISDEGTVPSSGSPYRVHNTDYWGSEGCFTGQTPNTGGSVTTATEQLNSWGLKNGDTMQGSLTVVGNPRDNKNMPTILDY
jgi:hypothetical protein